ncbi:hypothetical protein [Grimontia sp. NTOU-MAR1]|uniref:hypothetical protein n=1 Tax=Grimontia sp. NTOU-MAR1 TaxID=3111011 RepID=UPI002DBA8047|nr:hypothetical protein [Grimontia sp. NTOU-MAR1]WRW00371.1 hypothetical protein VP504_18095 [Grimontia sp. NTOU-MAR1]
MHTQKQTSTSLRFILLFITLTSLVGCTASRHDQLADLGFSTPYMEGYDDGCHSKVTAAQTYNDGYRQDPERMFKEPRYANGWKDGYEQCFVANKEFY